MTPQARDIDIVQQYLPLGRLHQTINAANQGTLTCSGRANDGDDLGVIDSKTDVAKRLGACGISF